MWQYTYADELYHYGVPGMKWGHRKAQPTQDVPRGRLGKKILKSQKQLSKRLKRDVSTQEADDFRKDLRYLDKLHDGTERGFIERIRFRRELTVTKGKEYAKAVFKQDKKNQLVKDLKSSIFSAVGNHYLNKLTNQYFESRKQQNTSSNDKNTNGDQNTDSNKSQ